MKLIAFDLDGTLIGSDHKTISRRDMKALKYAKEENIVLVPSSGRAFTTIPAQLHNTGLISYMITSNGAAIRDMNSNKNIYSNYIPSWQARRVLHVINYLKVPVELHSNGEIYVLASHLKYFKDMPDELKELYSKAHQIDEFMLDIPEQVEKIVLYQTSKEEGDYVRTTLDGFFPLSVLIMGNGSVEINNRNVNKGAALKYLCKYLNIDSSDVMTFGDNKNDIEMLEWADWSFAMDNGIESVKNAAKYIAPSNVHSGVAQMIEKYALVC